MTDENIVPEGETPAEDFGSTAGAAPQAGETAEPAPSEATPADGPVTDDQLPPDPFLEDETDWQALAAERTVDLQRLQAEYVNYKRRVDRDRALARQSGVEAVLSDLLPVMDGIELARSHDDLAGGFKLVADELAKVTGKHGLVAFGAVGEPFDPTRHEALMQVPMEGPVEVTTISQVMQQGYALGDRVLRPARVGVANPQ